MNDSTCAATGGCPPASTVAGLEVVAASLATVDGASDRELVDLLDGLERLKGAAAARQADLTVALDRIRVGQAVAAGRRPADGGVGTEIGLARRESPHRGRCHLRLARALTRDLPRTLDALRRGEISERRAEIVAVESSHLTREQRLALDTELAPRLPELGEAETAQAARRVALRLDEAGYLARRSRALSGRRVTTRHLSDGMSALTALLPSEVVSGIVGSLREAADRREATPGTADDRSRTQLVADLAAERLGGCTLGTGVPVAARIIVSAETLLGEDSEPARLAGYGYLPASIARAMIARGLSHALSSARRVFCFPGNGALVAMESDGRLLKGLLRELVVDVRDAGVCRTPWCNAPAAHADHVTPARRGGATSAVNTEGLCEGCNYAKETTGFRHVADLDDEHRHTVEVTTPGGRTYRSHAPPLPVPSWLLRAG